MNYAQLQAELRGMSKRDAVDRLHEHADTKSRSWCERNLQHLMALDHETFARAIVYADPVGNAVAINRDAGRTSLRPSDKKHGLGTVAKQCSEAAQTEHLERV